MFSMTSPNGVRNIYTLPASPDPGQRPTPRPSEFDETQGAFSPDGKWLAYTSNRDGEQNVYVRLFPDGGERRISTDGGYQPLWGPEGKELFYRSGDAVMVTSIETEPDFAAGVPTPLFPDRFVEESIDRGSNPRYFHIHPSGQLFLMVTRAVPAESGQFYLVEHWAEGELKQVDFVPIR